MPVRYSPRPVRALAHHLAPLVLAILFRLAIAVAVAGTLTHALLFWPESLLLTLGVLTLAVALVLTGREQVSA